MRKEVSFAVIIGIILGGAILFGINLANQSTSNLPQNQVPQILTPTPATREGDLADQKTQNETKIISHQDLDVVFETPLTISGKTSSNTRLAIITEEDDILIQSDDNGSFQTKINLVSGENKITLSTLLPNNTLHNQILTLYYSTTNLE